ncbi:MAG: DNRLRE domain-containing protein [Phaeodactylibacter sp.]|nr:DNRLRE domain-containing protein [Phaeodactylibacter sp.]
MTLRYSITTVILGLLLTPLLWGQSVSRYAQADAVAMESYPDSIIDQSANGNIFAYKIREGDNLNAVYSYLKFDISNLKGTQVESASFSYRGKTGDPDFEELFELELYSLKSDFDADALTWSNKPDQDKKLATSTLNASSARKAFINTDTRLIDYLNEAARKGQSSVGFLIRSAAKDSTSNMWIGGVDNGNYGPILEYTISTSKSGYALGDAVVMEAYPDSTIDQSSNGNIFAYRESADGSLKRVQSYVKYDISHLRGQQLETASFSYRGKTGDPDFEELFELELYSIKADFDEATVTWNNKPAQDKKLASSTLNASSARKEFINTDTRLIDYLNEEIRKGAATVGFLIRSAAKDSTSNMWIGGVDNGNYGPILDYTIAPKGSQYGLADAVAMEAYPDSVIDQSANGNIFAYRHSVDGALKRTQSYVKYDLSGLKGQQVENVSFSYRGKTGDPDFEELFELELYSLKADFDGASLTWNNKPAQDKKLATSTLNASSARKAFINDGSKVADYINEEIRKGASTVGFLIRSAAKDSTSNMWIGGVDNGNYGPILEYEMKPAASAYGIGDGVVKEAYPDSTIDQSANGNIFAYREPVDGSLKRTQSYVSFDISGLNGELAESAKVSYRGKTGDPDFEELFELELFSIKAGFDPETVTWNNKPAQDKKLASSTLNASSARKEFINTDTRLIDYINEEIRKGASTVGFLVRSAAKDSTSNMWIGGVDNGNYGPILDISRPNLFTLENDTLTVIEDVFVSQAEPDANFEIADADMHLINNASTNASKDIYLKFDISGSKDGIGAATLLLRGAQKDPPTQNENFRIQVFGTDSDNWTEGTLTWNTTPETTTGALAEYNITESAVHPVSGAALTAYVNEAIRAGRENLTFVIRGKEETTFRAWISSKNWVPAQLALDYSTQDLKIIEDSYVAEGAPDENYDGVTAMQVAIDETAGNDRETYLKFALDGARSNVVSAALIVKGDQEQSGIQLDNFYIRLFGVNDNSWSETDITWNNKPVVAGSQLLEYNVTESADHELSSPALTAFVKQAISQGNDYVSFAVKGRDDTPGSNVWISDQGWRPARLFLDYRQITAAPAFLTPEGDYIPEVTVEIAAQTPGSQIYYTLDGSEPSESSNLYSGGILLTDTATVRARAYAPELAPSEIVEATYNVAPVGTPVFSPTPLVEYNDAVTVTLSIEPDDAFIFYSDDGSDPLTPYPSSGILITESTTIRARGVTSDGAFFGPAAEATYTIVNTVPGTGTGPAGIGASDNSIAGQPENALWLKADGIEGASDGSQILEWKDLSGNGNDAYNTYVEGGNNAIPNTGESQKPAPTYLENALNGKPVLQFGLPDGSGQTTRSLIIDDADNLDGGAGISLFVVFKRNQMFADFAAVFQKRDITAGNATQAYVLEFNGGSNPHKMQFVIERQLFLSNNMEFNDQDYYIVNTELQGDFQQALFRTNGQIEKVNTFNQIIPAVDAPAIIAGFQPMNIAEVILYKRGLNAAQNLILHNYLAVKYGLDITDGANSIKLYSSEEYIEDLIGVGKDLYIDETTEQEHRSASGAGLQIDVRSQLSVGDYVLAAHNGAAVDDPMNWDRYWNIEVFGNAPNVDLSFDFEAAGTTIPGAVTNLKLFFYDGTEWVNTGLTPVLDEGKAKFAVDAIQSGLYRLAMAVSTVDIDQSENLTVFPNPVNADEVQIRLDNTLQGEAAIQLYDNLGRLVNEKIVEKSGPMLRESLSLRGLNNGFYLLKVIQNGQYQAVKKLAKQ